ncbi:hypothetical protein [Planotetraspora sp. GP83]|uniref:hypothetical protein n=1 Tax=Planotetraspora sp. GP83 TaxID=3156264 RepID=UPI0035155C90
MHQQPILRIPTALSGRANFEAADAHASHLEAMITAHRADAEKKAASARERGNKHVTPDDYLDLDQLSIWHCFAGLIRAQLAAAAYDPAIVAQGSEQLVDALDVPRDQVQSAGGAPTR